MNCFVSLLDKFFPVKHNPELDKYFEVSDSDANPEWLATALAETLTIITAPMLPAIMLSKEEEHRLVLREETQYVPRMVMSRVSTVEDLSTIDEESSEDGEEQAIMTVEMQKVVVDVEPRGEIQEESESVNHGRVESKPQRSHREYLKRPLIDITEEIEETQL